MLSEATNVLIATARNTHATEQQIHAAAQSFFGETAKASAKDANAALRSIGRHFDLDDPSRSAFLALACGVLVERGADANAIADPLTAALTPLLSAAGDLVDACAPLMPPLDDDQDPTEAFQTALLQVIPNMPQQAAAWQALDQFWHPAIAVYSASPQARRTAQSLRELAAKISQFHEAGHWLTLMMTVLDQEPILVIEPSTSLGIVGRISGIVDNFQLNTLLMDVFPQATSTTTRRVSSSAAEVARGRGPQEGEETITSVWNLYDWHGLQYDLCLPDPSHTDLTEAWIWNEGVPADIPVFEGQRVVLLGPPSYPRSWQSQRMFAALAAELRIERVLSPEEVRDWLQRIAKHVEPGT